jgi:prepilin-type N-terminal cleavage/methylation domain-containing protein
VPMRGFSLIELLIAFIVIGIMVSMALVEAGPTIQQWHADTAMYEVQGQLRWARQTSIAQRRDIQVQFLGNNEIKLIRQDEPAGQTVLSDLFLTGAAQFMLAPGMTDTPDGFGNASPVEFDGVAGGPPIMQFQSDGTFVDGNGNPVDGTVFVAIPSYPLAARAVTVLGATGRVRPYKRSGNGWMQ